MGGVSHTYGTFVWSDQHKSATRDGRADFLPNVGTDSPRRWPLSHPSLNWFE